MSPVFVKSIPPNTENWLRKLYDKNYNNDTSSEDKHETNYSMNNDTGFICTSLAFFVFGATTSPSLRRFATARSADASWSV